MDKKDKPTYSPSRLKKYAQCPLSFRLSLQFEAAISKSTQGIMRDGQLFEGYVFGFKANQDEKTLIGRKKKETIDLIKGHADFIRPAFSYVDRNDSLCYLGESYKYLEYDAGEYIVRGEADYIGGVSESGLQAVLGSKMDIGKAIWDLKYTGNIPRVWDWMQHKEDFLQAVIYPYIHYMNTDEILPFYYLVVENLYKTPVVRLLSFDTNDDTLRYAEGLIEMVHNDIFPVANSGWATCLGGKTGGRCFYLQHCRAGREVAGGVKEIDFNSLISKIDL